MKEFIVEISDEIHGRSVVERHFATAETKEQAAQIVKSRLMAKIEKQFEQVEVTTHEEIRKRNEDSALRLLAYMTGKDRR